MKLNIQIYLERSGFSLAVETQFNSGITALFGPSGAGKSTLLHCLAGLTNPDSGLIQLDTEILYDTRRKINIPSHRRKIGIVFQDCLLFPHLSVRANMEYGQTGDKQTRREQFDTITALLEIEPLLDRSITHLSGGEKKRVALARAILANPRWLLLDEPFSGLDQSLKNQILVYLRRLHQATEIPMILVRHCPDEIADLADEFFFMEKGLFPSHGTLTSGGIIDGACFCRSQDPKDLQKIKNWLIKNHSLRLETYRSTIRAV
jgi:molybdate transport system ATP-binding protein